MYDGEIEVGHRLDVSVVEQRGESGTWAVEAIDYEDGGAIYQTLFIGPKAEYRAYRFARYEYGTAA